MSDPIVTEILDELLHARLDSRAMLDAVVSKLSASREGTWLGVLLGKDPETATVIARNRAEPAVARYIDAFAGSQSGSGRVANAGMAQRVVETGAPVLLPETDVQGLLTLSTPGLREYAGAHPPPAGARSLGALFVPMRARGAVIGVLGLIERRGSRPLDDNDVAWVQVVADRAAFAIENAQLHEDAVRRLDRLTSLEGIGLAVAASPDLRLTLNLILEQALAQLAIDAAGILLLRSDGRTLERAVDAGFRSSAMGTQDLPVNEALPAGRTMGRRMETITALGAFSQFRRRMMFAREGFKSYGAVPLIARDRLLGLFELFHRSALAPDEEWFSFLNALASEAAMAIDSDVARQALQRQATSRSATRPAPENLRPSETRILRLVVSGRSNREIAEQLHISENTVKFHVRQILDKTGATNRTDLTRMAMREGWV